jgi:membrane-bound metal-dependent hydrolase YbcI (DUF457 family)
VFIGHFGLALGAKKAAPSVSLAMLFAACQLADLLWPTLVLAGIEVVQIRPGATAMTPLDFVSYPYSHSLVMLCVWGIALAAAYAALARAGAAAAVTIALLVVSHWVLDVVTHRPDMPITPAGTTRVGLGLWNSIPGTIAAESAIFAAGLAIYLRAAGPRTRGQTVGLWALVAVMLTIYLASAFGPPPPSAAAVVWSAQGIWLFVAWAYVVDRPAATGTGTGTRD